MLELSLKACMLYTVTGKQHKGVKYEHYKVCQLYGIWSAAKWRQGFPPSGIVARVSAKCTGFDSNGIATIKYEEINLPLAFPNTIYIVSEIVKVAEPQRDDFVCPAYGCKDAVYVNGQIVSVPGFIR